MRKIRYNVTQFKRTSVNDFNFKNLKITEPRIDLIPKR